MTEVHLTAETVWLRQEQMAQLFGRERSVIGKHVRNVITDGEQNPMPKPIKLSITFTACGFYPEAQKA